MLIVSGQEFRELSCQSLVSARIKTSQAQPTTRSQSVCKSTILVITIL